MRQHSNIPLNDHLLHSLLAIQQQDRYISNESIHQIAAKFSLPVSQVKSVVAFYSFFYTKACGNYHLLFSNCPSCGYQQGDRNLLQILALRLKVQIGQTRADGRVSLDETSCIGMCDHGASLLVNGQPLVGLEEESIIFLADLIEAATPIRDWPHAWFNITNIVQRQGLLLKEAFSTGEGLGTAQRIGANATLDIIAQSKLRGRGGAGFATGLKWRLCKEAAGDVRYVVCNADEGEPGTFKDRMLLQHQADKVFEGMTTCAFVIGAHKGFLYLRGEYRYLLPRLQTVLAEQRGRGLLGKNILGRQGFEFDIDIVVGAGAYICGEESALIESLEGKPGIPRNRPPFPVTHGYQNQPTVVNNVETFVAAASIIARGSDWFKSVGTEESTGCKLLSISGDCTAPGIYEYPFGTTIQQILRECGAKNTLAVQIGGPAGTLIGEADFQRTIGFEDLSTGGSFIVFSDKRNILQVIQNFTSFFAHESCGFCTPCRIGTTLLKRSMDKIAANYGTHLDIHELKHVSELVKQYSHCGLGHTAANPVLDGLRSFPELFETRLTDQAYTPGFDLDSALNEARRLTGRNDSKAHLDH
jgi:[NiFe] hydrogenase diaphorase moiety large subunit